MRPILILSLWGLTACGTQIGSETGFGCQVDSEEAVADLATAPTGFSLTPQQALDEVLGAFEGTLTLEAGGDSPMTMTITRAGDLVVERRSLRGDDSGAEPADLALDADCVDALRIPATIALEAGTALDESVSGSVFVTVDGAGSLSVRIDQEDLQGDATPPTLDVSELASVWMSVYATLQDEAWQGSVDFTGESFPSGSGDDASVSATLDPFGTFVLTPPSE